MLGDTLVPPLQIFSKKIRRYVSLISFKCLRSVPLFLSLLLYRGFAIISFVEWREIVGISWRTNSLVTTCAVSHASFGTPNQGISWVIIAYKHNRWSVKIPQIELTVFIHHDKTPTNARSGIQRRVRGIPWCCKVRDRHMGWSPHVLEYTQVSWWTYPN